MLGFCALRTTAAMCMYDDGDGGGDCAWTEHDHYAYHGRLYVACSREHNA
jgi:hypothetical protein